MQQQVLVVNTPESVSLELELAGLGSRFLAVMLDTFLQLLFLGVLALAVFLQISPEDLLKAELREAAESTWGLALAFLLFFLVFYAYYLLFEIAWKGQTPGKRLAGLRVLDRSGRPASAGALAIRNLVRMIDSLPVPVAYPAGVICFLTSRLGQRLGDLAAGTIVVRERRLQQPARGTMPGGRFRMPNVLPPEPLVVQMHARRLLPEERELVLRFLERRTGLSWESRRLLGQRLAVYLARRMEYPYELRHAEPFLETIFEVTR